MSLWFTLCLPESSQSLTKMNELLQRYRDKRPEIVFEWYDEPTGAEGWVVINSLRNGAAGGGTRMLGNGICRY